MSTSSPSVSLSACSFFFNHRFNLINFEWGPGTLQFEFHLKISHPCWSEIALILPLQFSRIYFLPSPPNFLQVHRQQRMMHTISLEGINICFTLTKLWQHLDIVVCAQRCSNLGSVHGAGWCRKSNPLGFPSLLRCKIGTGVPNSKPSTSLLRVVVAGKITIIRATDKCSGLF